MGSFEINPYIGYNNIKFGMSQEDVAIIDGIAPKILIDNIINNTFEYRNGSIKLTFIENKFVDIWIPEEPADNQVFIFGTLKISLFQSNYLEMLKKGYQWIESKNKRFLLFPEIGICAAGCGEKKMKEGKTIMAFCKERLEWYETFINA